MGPLDLDHEKDLPIFDVCGSLKIIKQHNRGVLPEEFRKEWEDFACDHDQ